MRLVWKPNTTVASVIERDGLFLMVEEHTADGLRFNQPAGHLERGESLIDAAVRETLEETAFCFEPQCLVGVYQWTTPSADTQYLRFAFGGSAVDHEPARALDQGIVRALWMSRDELRECVTRHRSPLVMQCVDDWCSGRRAELDLLRYFS